MAKRGPKPGSKNHSEFEQAAGVMLLAANGNDYQRTAEMLGVHVDTLRHWEELNSAKKAAIPILLENTIRKLLEMMPDKWTGNTWAVAFGILMDKWLLVNGQPTQRTESLLGSIDDLPEEEKDAIIREAEQIIRDATEKIGGGDSLQEAQD